MGPPNSDSVLMSSLGPDDRLALAFVVQLCAQNGVTASVVRVRKTEASEVAPSTASTDSLSSLPRAQTADVSGQGAALAAALNERELSITSVRHSPFRRLVDDLFILTMTWISGRECVPRYYIP